MFPTRSLPFCSPYWPASSIVILPLLVSCSSPFFNLFFSDPVSHRLFLCGRLEAPPRFVSFRRRFQLLEALLTRLSRLSVISLQNRLCCAFPTRSSCMCRQPIFISFLSVYPPIYSKIFAPLAPPRSSVAKFYMLIGPFIETSPAAFCWSLEMISAAAPGLGPLSLFPGESFFPCGRSGP